MASADCVVSAGVYVAASPYKTGSADCIVSCGTAVAASRVAWAGTVAPRKTNDWLPRADEQWFDPKTGRPTRRFYQFMREIAEVRLGGVQGKTVPQVHEDVVVTQTAVVDTASYATQVGQYAQSVAATAQATAEVVQTSSLPGSETIPEPSEPPTYSPHVNPDDI